MHASFGKSAHGVGALVVGAPVGTEAMVHLSEPEKWALLSGHHSNQFIRWPFVGVVVPVVGFNVGVPVVGASVGANDGSFVGA